MPAESPPTRPETFGAELRGLRENAGISLDQIIAETKISRRVLEALESGRFQLLPEPVFSRNFVAQYARLVGADRAALLDLFDAAWERFLVESGSHPSALVPETSLASPVRWRFWIPIALCAVVLGTVGVVIVKDRIGPARPGVEPSRWEVAGGLETRPPGPPTPEARPTRDIASPLPEQPQQAEAADDDTVDLSLSVAGGSECWIRYRDREGRTGQQLLSRGQDLDIELMGPVLLTLGNAAAVTLRVGGVEYRDLGLPGQVLHTEVSRHGVVRLGEGEPSE